MFYQKCQASESLDEEQTTSQDNKVSLSKHERLPPSSSALPSSPTDIEINADPVLTTTSSNNDQRKNSTIASDILNINRVTKVFSSTILTTTPSTESSGYNNFRSFLAPSGAQGVTMCVRPYLQRHIVLRVR